MSYKEDILDHYGIKKTAGSELKVKPDPRIFGGDQCPFCGSHDVSFMTGRDEGLEVNGSNGVQSLQCYNCKAQWEEHFALKLKKHDVKKYPFNVLAKKPAGGSPVERAKTWTVKRGSEQKTAGGETYTKMMNDARAKVHADFLKEVVKGLKNVKATEKSKAQYSKGTFQFDGEAEHGSVLVRGSMVTKGGSTYLSCKGYYGRSKMAEMVALNSADATMVVGKISVLIEDLIENH